MNIIDAYAVKRSTRSEFKLEWRKTKSGKMEAVLPALPKEREEICAWLTCVLALDPTHPIVSGEFTGPHGIDSSVILRRAGAPELRFSPRTRLSTPARLLEVRNACAIDSDDIAPIKGEHIPLIDKAIRVLCAASATQSTRERAERVVRTFLQHAQAVDGHTLYDTTSGQRYEAAFALRRPCDPSGHPEAPRYLVDTDSGELVVRVSDLTEAARAALGTGLRRGELEELVRELGWTEASIDGHQLPGRAGRTGPHAVAQVLRGPFAIDVKSPAAEDDDDPGDQVTTRDQPPTGEGDAEHRASAYSVGNGLVTWSRSTDVELSDEPPNGSS